MLTLECGRLRLQLSPSIGGSICALEWVGEGGARPILRKCHTPPEKVLDAACFPLVPYVNRIRDGRFRFRGREVRLEPNMPGDPSPLHGQGWLNPWTVERQDGTSAARIEEEIVVTETGHEVITRFPAEQLLVCGAPFVTVNGQLPIVRETENPPNDDVKRMVAAAQSEAVKPAKVGA